MFHIRHSTVFLENRNNTFSLFGNMHWIEFRFYLV